MATIKANGGARAIFETDQARYTVCVNGHILRKAKAPHCTYTRWRKFESGEAAETWMAERVDDCKVRRVDDDATLSRTRDQAYWHERAKRRRAIERGDRWPPRQAPRLF